MDRYLQGYEVVYSKCSRYGRRSSENTGEKSYENHDIQEPFMKPTLKGNHRTRSQSVFHLFYLPPAVCIPTAAQLPPKFNIFDSPTTSIHQSKMHPQSSSSHSQSYTDSFAPCEPTLLSSMIGVAYWVAIWTWQRLLSAVRGIGSGSFEETSLHMITNLVRLYISTAYHRAHISQ